MEVEVAQQEGWRCPGADPLDMQSGQFKKIGPGEEIALIGSGCSCCGAVMFPSRQRCAHCFSNAVESRVLPRNARVVTYTIVRQAPAGYSGPVPYVLGQVRLAPHLLVLSHLVGKGVDEWHAGDAVESVNLDLCEGRSAHAFRPSI